MADIRGLDCAAASRRTHGSDFPRQLRYLQYQRVLGSRACVGGVASLVNSVLEHKPVLLDETMDALVSDIHGDYLDATFGRGGHARALMHRVSSRARLLVMDRDPEAVSAAKSFCQEDERVRCAHGKFSELQAIAETNGFTRFAGILMDLGVSSPQLNDANRGFSFSAMGPLDMRMDPSSGIPAERWINSAAETEMASVFRDYGEERNARAIARRVIQRRPLSTTMDLVDVIASIDRRADPRKHAATRVFQAIRIHINDELNELERGLDLGFDMIVKRGRFAVLSFHSLEHRIVRRKFRALTSSAFPRRLPVSGDPSIRAHVVVKGTRPTTAEVNENPRARSALLQVIERAD